MPEHAIVTLRLETADGTADYPIGPSELFHFERRYPGLTVDEALRAGAKLEHLLFLAWRSAMRRKVIGGQTTLEEFVDTLEGMDLADLRAQAADLVAVAAVPLDSAGLRAV